MSDDRIGVEVCGAFGRTLLGTWSDMTEWRYGHPRAALLHDGTVFVVFYAGATASVTDVRWARLEL